MAMTLRNLLVHARATHAFIRTSTRNASLSLLLGMVALAGMASAQTLVPGPELGLMSVESSVRLSYVAPLPDGRVLVSGQFSAVDGHPRPALALLNADGTLVPNWPAVPSEQPQFGWYPALGNDETYVYLSSPGTGLKRMSIATGRLDPNWPGPYVDAGRIIPHGPWLYATSLRNGVFEQRVGRLDRATGALDAWNPDPDNYVSALVPDGNDVYLAGLFRNIKGAQQIYVAKVDGNTGSLVPGWSPVVNEQVGQLVVGADGVFIVGSFTQVNGQSRARNAKLDKANAAVIPAWQPPAGVGVGLSFADGNTLYGFLDMPVDSGGQTYYRLTRLSAQTGAPIGQPLSGAIAAFDTLNAIAKHGDALYVVGSEWQDGNAIERPGKIDLATATAVSSFDPLVGITSQARLYPQADGTYIAVGEFTHSYRTPRSMALKLSSSFQLDPDWAPRIPFTSFPRAVKAALSTPDGVYLVGTFSTINGATRNAIAKLDHSTGSPLPWTVTGLLSPEKIALSGNYLYVDDTFGVRRVAVSGGAVDTSWSIDAHGSNVSDFIVTADAIIVSSSFDKYLFKADLVTGALTPGWNPAPNQSVQHLMRDGDDLYVTGTFWVIGGLQRPGAARLNIHTGQVDASWVPAHTGHFFRSGPDLFVYSADLGFGKLDPVTGAEDPCWPAGWPLPNSLKRPGAPASYGPPLIADAEGLMLSGAFVNGQGNEAQGWAHLVVGPKLKFKSVNVTPNLIVGDSFGIELETQDRQGAAYPLPLAVNAAVTHNGAGVLSGNIGGQIVAGQSTLALGPMSYSMQSSELRLVTSASGGPTLRSCRTNIKVKPAQATATISSSRNPAKTNTSVTLRFTVSHPGSLGAPAGTVQFLRNNFTIPGCSSVPVVGGVAQCTTTLFSQGEHLMGAAYSGDNVYDSEWVTYTQYVRDSAALARADVGGDGRSDIVWYHTGVFGVIGMNANGLSLDPYYIVDVRSDANWKIVGLGDLNGDGRSDLVWYNAATGEAHGLLLDGGTLVGEGRIHLEPNLDWKPEQIADLNGDGRADIVWKNQTSGSVFVMLMNGLAQSGGQIVYTEPNLNWKIVASGDMNGDGRADLLWRNVATGDVFSMLMDGFTVTGGGVIYTEPNLSWKIIGLADYNGDGRADVLWQNTATGDVFEMQMNGTAVSAGQVIYNEPNTQWKIVALGDYNGDGRADVLWQNIVTGQVYMMLMNGFTVTSANFVYIESDTQWQIVGP
jgi:hypothetical protein